MYHRGMVVICESHKTYILGHFQSLFPNLFHGSKCHGIVDPKDGIGGGNSRTPSRAPREGYQGRAAGAVPSKSEAGPRRYGEVYSAVSAASGVVVTFAAEGDRYGSC